MRLSASIASLVAATLFACGGKAKKAPEGPSPDDVPTAVTCCITTAADQSEQRNVVPEGDCAEGNRNPVDECNVGPGEDEPR